MKAEEYHNKHLEIKKKLLAENPFKTTHPGRTHHSNKKGYKHGKHANKLEITVTTSSTETEFVQAVSATKMAKYLCTVLNELGIVQQGPTMIYKDNTAAILVANANKPNSRTRHIDISYFALQEWVQCGEVKLAHIQGVVNPADALTKALGWTLCRRHATQMMGRVVTVYTSMSGRI
eukprot:15352063-Ditylum_brightwellii.AAC.1